MRLGILNCTKFKNFANYNAMVYYFCLSINISHKFTRGNEITSERKNYIVQSFSVEKYFRKAGRKFYTKSVSFNTNFKCIFFLNSLTYNKYSTLLV